jgi:hypothetical protein
MKSGLITLRGLPQYGMNKMTAFIKEWMIKEIVLQTAEILTVLVEVLKNLKQAEKDLKYQDSHQLKI